ncbi:MAG TPA: hypothetical protein VLF94_06970 [Chlamydiales bacterium]|nr:hypothetical protein [Chlamydiales bacterium]
MVALAQPQVTSKQEAWYDSLSHKPPSLLEIHGPMISASTAVSSAALSFLAKVAVNSNPWCLTFAALAAAPGVVYGRQVYTDWIPTMVRDLAWGECVRKWKRVPDADRGIPGWQDDSTHSNHFDAKLADALVGLHHKKRFASYADFECGGRGLYPETFKKAGIAGPVGGYDFSQASVLANKDLWLASLYDPQPRVDETYDLVTSFEAISKGLPEQVDAFIMKLIHATRKDGMLVMSCAHPGQAGPNCSWRKPEEIIAFCKQNGCRYNEAATMKLRRAAGPMHPWLKENILAFDKVG